MEVVTIPDMHSVILLACFVSLPLLLIQKACRRWIVQHWNYGVQRTQNPPLCESDEGVTDQALKRRVDGRHRAWHLTSAPREPKHPTVMDTEGMDAILTLLETYDVDKFTGFLPSKDPLQRLQCPLYQIWEDLGDDLSKLLGARQGQARGPLAQLPALTIDHLTSVAELRRAHLLLCLFAHAYVFGGTEPIDVLPEGIAIPLCEVSHKLDIPPVLAHPSIVLYNWRRLDAEGSVCMENLSTLNNFFDGRDESWFYLITVEVEARGAAAVLPSLLAIDAIRRYNDAADNESELNGVCSPHFPEDAFPTTEGYAVLQGELSASRVAAYVTAQLARISAAIAGMNASLRAMHEGCHPFIFYHRVRPFLSGWKHNPTLPHGVLYSGVSAERQQYYGGSAAQSALLPMLDIVLGVVHDSVKSRTFLLAMRDYMLRSHREFLKHLEGAANIRQFVVQQRAILVTDVAENTSAESVAARSLSAEYDRCVELLRQFRSIHMKLVADYIVAQQREACTEEVSAQTHQKSADAAQAAHPALAQPLVIPRAGLENSAGGKGTGGTDLMKFLRPIRDDCNASFLSRPGKPPRADRSLEPSGAVAEPVPLEAAKQPAANTAPSASLPRVDSSLSEYFKSNGSCADIDLYRGAAATSSFPATVPASADASPNPFPALDMSSTASRAEFQVLF